MTPFETIARVFGFHYGANSTTWLDSALWWVNLAVIAVIYTAAMVNRNVIFLTATNASFTFDIVLYSAPVFTHLLILCEARRNRKWTLKFWRLLEGVDKWISRFGHIRAQFDHRCRRLVFLTIYTLLLPCTVVDLYALYVYRNSRLYLLLWTFLIWSFTAIRVFLFSLLITLTIVRCRLECLTDIMDSLVIYTKWRRCNQVRVEAQVQEIQLLYCQVSQLLDCVNRSVGWILLIYSFYIFDFLTYILFWQYKFLLALNAKTLTWFLYNILYIFSSLVGFFHLVFACEAISDQVNRLKSSYYEIRGLKLQRTFHFALAMFHSKIVISAAGFFNFDFGMMMNILAATITYILMLQSFQFQTVG